MWAKNHFYILLFENLSIFGVIKIKICNRIWIRPKSGRGVRGCRVGTLVGHLSDIVSGDEMLSLSIIDKSLKWNCYLYKLKKTTTAPYNTSILYAAVNLTTYIYGWTPFSRNFIRIVEYGTLACHSFACLSYFCGFHFLPAITIIPHSSRKDSNRKQEPTFMAFFRHYEAVFPVFLSFLLFLKDIFS